jgi:hypothetical protein
VCNHQDIGNCLVTYKRDEARFHCSHPVFPETFVLEMVGQLHRSIRLRLLNHLPLRGRLDRD